MDLCQNMNKIELLEKIVAEEPVESGLTEKFNAEISFGEKELISLLFYLGYLTIKENEFGVLKFVTPNEVIRTIYSNYFLEYIKRKAGIKDERIILDPGVGFGKTYEMNLETMNHLELFQHLGFPVLLGTSRKSMIGLALDLPVDQRVEGTIATSVIGVMKGCVFVRVHDVKENKRAVLMTEAILGRNIK